MKKDLLRIEDPLYPFYVIAEEEEKNLEAIVFIHGLGENRSGLNYVFAELGHKLFKENFNTYRFDLSGCGDNPHPLDIDIWKSQLNGLLSYLNCYEKIHIVGRGIGRIIIPLDYKKGRVLLLNKCTFDAHSSGLTHIGEFFEFESHIEPANVLTDIEKDFWLNLSIEPECIGGISISMSFMEDVKQRLSAPINCSWKYFDDYFSPKDLLYRYKTERDHLFKFFMEVLNED